MTAPLSPATNPAKSYMPPLAREGTDMIETVSRFTAFALYQLTVLLGIVLLPVALATRRIGLQLPVASVLDSLEATHESI